MAKTNYWRLIASDESTLSIYLQSASTTRRSYSELEMPAASSSFSSPAVRALLFVVFARKTSVRTVLDCSDTLRISKHCKNAVQTSLITRHAYM